MKLKCWHRGLFLLCILFMLPLGSAFAQQGRTAGTDSISMIAQPAGTPIPLTRLSDTGGQTASQSPKLSKGSALGRFITISFGAFPFMFFNTNLAFDVTEFAASGFDLQYAPWPVQNRFSSLPVSEQLLRIGIASSVSLAIAVCDAVFPQARRK